MKFSLLHKIGLSILAFCGLGLALLWISIHFLFQSSFLDYLNEQSRPALNAAADRLGEYYQQQGSWEPLRENQALWARLSSGQTPPHLQRPNGRRGQDWQPPNRSFPRPPRPDNRDSRDNPNIRALLLDRNEVPVIGFMKLSDQSGLMREEIRVDGEVVGYLAVERRNRITAAIDRNFASSLNKSMLIVLAFALVFSLAIAFLLARNISKPIRALSDTTTELRQGNYAVRSTVYRSDELGKLSEDFNRLAAVLEANRDAQKRWVADISHELRTPLAIMRAELQAVEDGIRPFDEKTLASLSAEIDRFSHLVNDLYDLSRAEAGDLSYQMDKLVLKDILEQAVESFKSRYEEKGLDLSLDTSELNPSWTISADPTRITQLFSNLLENSFRYTKAPGKAEISCEPATGGQVRILIQDTAPSVPENSLERIFERLYRVEQSRSSAFGGGGLGLALCKAITEAHEGSILAKKSDLGGLCIEVLLPIINPN